MSDEGPMGGGGAATGKGVSPVKLEPKYGAGTSRHGGKRTGLYAAIGVLAAGLAGYSFACLPAMFQRGYPGIEPWLEGLTWTWFVPVALATALEDRLKRCWVPLLIYAVLTGYVDAGTIVQIVPHRPDPVGMIGMALLVSGPLHVLGTALTFWVSKKVLHRGKELRGRETTPARVPRAKMLLFTTVVLTAGVLVPAGYSRITYWRAASRAAAAAEGDWRDGRAVWPVRPSDPEYSEASWVDGNLMPGWGLPMRRIHGGPVANEWAMAYRERIRKLATRDGIPQVANQLLTATEIKSLIRHRRFAPADDVTINHDHSDILDTKPSDGESCLFARLKEKGDVVIVISGNRLETFSAEGKRLQFMFLSHHGIEMDFRAGDNAKRTPPRH